MVSVRALSLGLERVGKQANNKKSIVEGKVSNKVQFVKLLTIAESNECKVYKQDFKFADSKMGKSCELKYQGDLMRLKTMDRKWNATWKNAR